MSTNAVKPILGWCVLFAVGIPWLWWRLDFAERDAITAQQHFNLLQQQIAHLTELRTLTQIAHGPRADADLVSRAQRALAQAGVPVGVFNSIQPQGDQQQVDGVHLQEVQLRLQGITHKELGAWLQAWLTPDQPWTIRSLQATHVNQGVTTDESNDNRFNISINLSTPYVDNTQ